MADETRPPFDRVGLLRALARAPYEFDFHQTMRRLEHAFGNLPRWGEAQRPSEEPLRLGQDPSMTFAPSSLSTFKPADESGPARLAVAFLGLFGPLGPLPLHLTEYVRERIRNVGDGTFAAFADIFHHRMLVLFHRAWAQGRPTASRDRRRGDRFLMYVGAIAGLTVSDARVQTRALDLARLYLAGRHAQGVKNPEGLRAVLISYLGLPVSIEEFIAEWLTVPNDARFRLGHSPEVSSLGRTTVLGARAFSRTQKFRVVLGPLSDHDFSRFLPGNAGLTTVTELVEGYVGHELAWELELVPAAGSARQLSLGRTGRLGFDAVLGALARPLRRAHVLVDPATQQTERMLA